MRCPNCRETGERICPVCNGKKYLEHPNFAYMPLGGIGLLLAHAYPVRYDCTECGGEGTIKCTRCGGSGEV